jgi:hypothetical protein
MPAEAGIHPFLFALVKDYAEPVSRTNTQPGFPSRLSPE